MMLTCEDVNQFLAAYLEGDVPPALRRRYEKHVERCSVCSTYLRQYRQTVDLTHESAVLDPEPPEELVDLTMAFLRKHWDEESGRAERSAAS